MLTTNDILTSSGKYPDRPKKWPPTAGMLADAGDLALRANRLLASFGASRKATSGYRPDAVNANVPGAAKKSNHRLCRAVDLEDGDGKLDAFCLSHQDLLAQLGLWLESPASTPGWCHVQIVAPGSGHRVFIP